MSNYELLISIGECNYCGEPMRSPYTFPHKGKWYSCHKYCCFALKSILEKKDRGREILEQLELDFENGTVKKSNLDRILGGNTNERD